ncbi:MAG: PKD domain-containing protein, partial [candidate division Zixibacteria bacterium]|nr:PKD domain-containing protein [candidate division Zixibacteria bacterium]
MRTRLVSLILAMAVLCLLAADISAQPIRVNVMPDGIWNDAANIYTAYAWPNPDTALTIWGNVIGGTAPYTYEWDFGDGSAIVTGAVTDPRYIAVTHGYATMGPKYATLIVTDNVGASDTDVVQIDVVTRNWDSRVNLAIQKGLRWLYLHNYGYISWQGWGAEGQYQVGAFGMEVLAFCNRGHMPFGDPDEDIYAEHVKAGLDIVTLRSGTQTIGAQPYGNPDSDGDGIGIWFSNGTRPCYEVGIGVMAIVACGAPDSTAATGPAGVIGETYHDIVVDAMDWIAWSQNDYGGRGGWRYYANYGNSDNSVSQWPTIGMEAAEFDWTLAPPAFVKSELLVWTTYSQNANGGFGYNNNGAPNVGRTGAGICELSFADVPYDDTRVQNALNYLNNNWYQGTNTSSGNFGNLYAMYGVAKGCRIAVDAGGDPHEIQMVGAHDWQTEYNEWLVENQHPDGYWNGSNYGSNLIDTDFGILILTPSITCDPVAVISAPASTPANTEITLDGSGSYYTCGTADIVEWLWDYDKSDGLDWENPDGAGENITHPGFPLPPGVLADTITITLRVKDNSDLEDTDIEEHEIVIDTVNHAPIADCGGPYAARVGEEIVFDGTGSYDPDPGDSINSYSWDLNGDGVFDDCFDSTCTESWDAVYSGYIGLIVTDNFGAGSDDTCHVTIWTSEMDVHVDDADVSVSNPAASPGQVITVAATVHCHVDSDPVSGVNVRFYDGDPSVSVNQIGVDQFIPSMSPGEAVSVDVAYTVGDTLPRHLYVRVDPDQEIEEFDETNNEASYTLAGSTDCFAMATIDPFMQYMFYVHAVIPMSATIYLGEFSGDFVAIDVNPATVMVNDSIAPTSWEIITDPDIFPGDIFKLTFPIAPFILGYGWVWDSTEQEYTVNWRVGGKPVQCSATGTFVLWGHRSGDLNLDGSVDIADLLYMVDFMFRGGPAPEIVDAADVNGDCAIDIGDLTFFVEYFFGGGDKPAAPCSQSSQPTAKIGHDVEINSRYVDGGTIISMNNPVEVRGVQLNLSGHS